VSAKSAPDAADGESAENDRNARGRAAYREGNERLFSGNVAAAIKAYEEAIHLNPKDPAGYRGLGLAYAQQGKRSEAVRYLRAYLRRAPDAADRAIIGNRIALITGGGS
jgi:tetratricopeptide (TPR) repeat protein